MTAVAAGAVGPDGEPLVGDGPPAGGPGGVGADGDIARVVRRVFALEIEALQDTVRHLDAEAARRAVEALAGAGGVLFIGTGAAMALSELAAYRLKVLGLRASWAGDPGTILPEIHLLGPGDVLCAISYHGATRHVVEALDHARQRGLTTICLTAVPGSPAAQRADIRLVAFGQQTALGFGQFASRVAVVALLDALAAAVAWRRDGAVAHATELVAVMQGNNTVAERRRPAGAKAPADGNGLAGANGKSHGAGRNGAPRGRAGGEGRASRGGAPGGPEAVADEEAEAEEEGTNGHGSPDPADERPPPALSISRRCATWTRSRRWRWSIRTAGRPSARPGR